MTRHDLPKLIKHNGIGLELGVASGHYSNAILLNSTLSVLYSVDIWRDHHNQAEYEKCKKLLSIHKGRSKIIRKDFSDALIHFKDSYFDFIYIDGYADGGQQNGKLLYDWYPKLKIGGIFSGHDYCNTFPLTVKAVDDFCSNMEKRPIIIDGDVSDKRQQNYNSWYFIK